MVLWIIVIRGAFPEAMVGIYALGVARIDRPLVPLVVVQEGVEVQAADSPHPAGQHLRHLLRPLRHHLLLHLCVAKRAIHVLIFAQLYMFFTLKMSSVSQKLIAENLTVEKMRTVGQ